MAAVLACRRAGSESPSHDDRMDLILERWGAALSHRSAACLWELLPLRDGPLDVTVPGDGGKTKRRGVRVHRSVSLLPADVTLCSGIPVTKVARTIADLRRVVPKQDQPGLISRRELRRAIRQANVCGLPIGEDEGSDRTRSDLERAFLSLCRGDELPRPEVNPLERPEADCGSRWLQVPRWSGRLRGGSGARSGTAQAGIPGRSTLRRPGRPGSRASSGRPEAFTWLSSSIASSALCAANQHATFSCFGPSWLRCWLRCW